MQTAVKVEKKSGFNKNEHQYQLSYNSLDELNQLANNHNCAPLHLIE